MGVLTQKMYQLPDAMRYVVPTREGIMLLENTLRTMGPPVELELKHHFCNGVYGREMRAPAGTLIVGKIHKFEHLNVVSKGLIVVATEFGIETISAGQAFISKPGVKRAGYVLEDVIWTTFHHTDKTIPEDVEADVIAKTYEELDQFLLGVQ